MKNSVLALALLVLSCVASVGSLAEESDLPAVQPIKSFEFLGCGGDWNDEHYTPEVTRLGSSAGTTLLVRHPETCGADAARNPRVTLNDGVLDLSYEPYSSSDVYAMCPCEYWAKFTLEGPAASARSATFRSIENWGQSRLSHPSSRKTLL